MKYSILKDNTPKKTITRIKRILKKNNICIREQVVNKQDETSCIARIYITGTNNLGSNGKGTSEENCLASAYAELMERIQTGLIFQPYLFVSEQDEEIKNINDLEITESEKNVFKIINKILLKEKSILELKYQEKFNFNPTEGQTSVVPFISVKNKKIKYLPINEIKFLQGSNGAAAGNTYEEALVQGLSEICERYSMRQIFEKNIKMPLIPYEYINQYEKIKQIISYIENKGVSVTIKDASLGIGLPAICSIFEDKNSNEIINLSFGAHPSLPIAIERTLTEFLQGYDIENDFERDLNKYININDYESISRIVKRQFANKCAFPKKSKFLTNILCNDCDYNFSKETWIINEKVSNKSLAKKLISKILEFSDEIYIRDYNFMGFPTIYIYVPEISKINLNLDENNYLNLEDWIEFSFSQNTAKDFDSFCNACYFSSFSFSDKYLKLSRIFPEYWGFLSAILKEDYEKIKIYGEVVKNNFKFFIKTQKTDINLSLLEGILLYFDLKSCGKEKNDIMQEITNTYSETTAKETDSFISNLDFEKIKILLIKNPDKKSFIFSNYILDNLKETRSKQYKKKCPKQHKLLNKINDNSPISHLLSIIRNH